MACFPGLAGAEDNSGIQYETDVPTVPGNQSSNIPSKDKSGGSSTPSESGASSSESPGGAGSGGNDSGQGGGTSKGQGNQAGGGGGKQGGNGSPNAGGVDGAKPLPVESAPTSSSGGSSPLVPILIAVAVLAAISIGYFFYRQRRPGSGPPVSSPKAS
jgi:cobalamin biosynthesis Mg chelatase CobN